MILAPRSWPSRPGLATRTRMGERCMPREYTCWIAGEVLRMAFLLAGGDPAHGLPGFRILPTGVCGVIEVQEQALAAIEES